MTRLRGKWKRSTDVGAENDDLPVADDPLQLPLPLPDSPTSSPTRNSDSI